MVQDRPEGWVDEASQAGSGPLSGLEALLARAAPEGSAGPQRAGPAPVERWNPAFCGDLDIRIAADGTWFYTGTPIGRPSLVRLFASVLRKDEDGRTYLVTPGEKIAITVDDAPFLAVEMDRRVEPDGPVLSFRTNVGDVVEAGPDHALRFVTDEATGGLKPYLLVRGRLEALLTRAVTLELVGHGETVETDDGDMFAIRSRGALFPIAPAHELASLR